MGPMAELVHSGIAGHVHTVSPRQEAVLRSQGWFDHVEVPAETPTVDPGVTVDPVEDDVDTSELPPPPPDQADEADTQEN